MHFNKSARLKVKKLYTKDKLSLAEISRIEGCPNDPKTIRTWLTQMDVKLRDTRQYPRKEILREWKKRVREIKVDPKKLEEGQTLKGVRRTMKARIRLDLQAKYSCSPKYLSNLIREKIKP